MTLRPPAESEDALKSRPFALRLFTLAGVPIQVHGSLIVLMAVATTAAWALGGWREALHQGLWWGLLFGLVLLHELGHLASARLLHVPVTSVVLWPLGGFTAVRLPPGRFGAELLIALAGPAVHLLIALALGALGLGGIPPNARGGRWDLGATAWLLNLLLGAFNLLPIFPMDGGRVLRSALAIGLGEGRGTWLALRMGQAGAMGIGGLAAWQLMNRDPGGLVTMTLAMWLLGQTLQEAQLFRRQERLQRAPLTPYPQPLRIAISDRVPLPAACRLLAHSGQPLLPLESAGQWTHGLFMDRGKLRRIALQVVEEEDSIATAWAQLAWSEGPGLLVTRRGRPVGWLARERVEALLREGPP